MVIDIISKITRMRKCNAIKLTNVRKIRFVDVDNKFKRVANYKHQNDSHQHCCCCKVPGKEIQMFFKI